MVIEGVKTVAETIFSLEEPWQSRFLTLVANHATDGAWDGRLPAREEIAAWLEADRNLCREAKLWLNAWRRPIK